MVDANTIMVLLKAYAPYAKEPLKMLLGISVYSLFVFKFYKFMGQRDIFEVDGKNGGHINRLRKLLSETAYGLKYLVFSPIAIFFWSFFITLLLTVMSKNQDVSSILVTSIGLVGAVRLTAYYNEDLSKDLAKLLPLGILAVYMVDPTYFSLETILKHIYGLADLKIQLAVYFSMIVLLEWALRLGHGIFKKEPEKSD